MWRFKSLAVVLVLLGVLLFGAVVAHAGWYWNAWYWNAWYWNANTSSQGVDFRTAWTVMPDGSDEGLDGDEYNYYAQIELRVPEGADFQLMEQAGTETVALVMDGGLECKADGIEAEVYYDVTPLEGAQADLVKVWVTANGALLDQATGHLYETLKVQVLIPADNPSCFQGGP